MHHAERSHAIVLEGALDRVFPLFTPIGERVWAPGWSPRFLHPEDGRACEGMTFTTGDGEETTFWSLVMWRPQDHRVRYARLTPATRLALVDVACRAVSQGATEARVSYRFTATSPAGQAWVAAMTDDAFAAMTGEWKRLIDAWLLANPGKILAV